MEPDLSPLIPRKRESRLMTTRLSERPRTEQSESEQTNPTWRDLWDDLLP
jgi:hypothetical protein